MSGRGDLGFIANSTSRMANRNFIGSSGHSSKKGVVGVSQASKMNADDSINNLVKPEFTADSIISKRTEWLESQERRMSATINETRSEHNLLTERLSKFNEDLSSIQNVQNTNSARLYDEMQTIFGKVDSDIIKVIPSSMNIENYEAEPKPILEEYLLQNEEWILLVYPMKNIQVSENHVQSFMRWKRVDKFTGQLSLHWVVIYEKNNDEEKRHISEFSSYVR